MTHSVRLSVGRSVGSALLFFAVLRRFMSFYILTISLNDRTRPGGVGLVKSFSPFQNSKTLDPNFNLSQRVQRITSRAIKVLGQEQ